jgi:hypothetical protein
MGSWWVPGRRDIQPNDVQLNYSQYTGLYCGHPQTGLSVIMLDIVMLNVVMLCGVVQRVLVLSVVALGVCTYKRFFRKGISSISFSI